MRKTRDLFKKMRDTKETPWPPLREPFFLPPSAPPRQDAAPPEAAPSVWCDYGKHCHFRLFSAFHPPLVRPARAPADHPFPSRLPSPVARMEAAPPEVPRWLFRRSGTASGGAASCRAVEQGKPPDGRGRPSPQSRTPTFLFPSVLQCPQSGFHGFQCWHSPAPQPSKNRAIPLSFLIPFSGKLASRCQYWRNSFSSSSLPTFLLLPTVRRGWKIAETPRQLGCVIVSDMVFFGCGIVRSVP